MTISYEAWRAKQRRKWNENQQQTTAVQKEALEKRLKIIEKEIKEKMYGKQKINTSA